MPENYFKFLDKLEVVGIRMEANMWIVFFNALAICSTISITVAMCFSMIAFALQSPKQTGEVNDVAGSAKGTVVPKAKSAAWAR